MYAIQELPLFTCNALLQPTNVGFTEVHAPLEAYGCHPAKASPVPKASQKLVLNKKTLKIYSSKNPQTYCAPTLFSIIYP